MMSTADRLAREMRTLEGCSGRQFFLELRAHVERLDRDPVLAAEMNALRSQGEEVFLDFERYDLDGATEATELRNELVRLAPDLDDSTMERPGFTEPSMQYEQSLARFDEIVNGASPRRGIPLEPTGREDYSRTGTLIGILKNKTYEARWRDVLTVAETDQRPELEELDERLGHSLARHRHRHRAFLTDVATDPGVALLRLDEFLTNLNPEPMSPDVPREERLQRNFETAIRGVVPLLDAILYGSPTRDQIEKAAELEQQIRGEIGRVHTELQRRATTADLATADRATRLEGAVFKLGPLLCATITGMVLWTAMPGSRPGREICLFLTGAVLTLFGSVAIERRLFNLRELALPSRLASVVFVALILALSALTVVAVAYGCVAASDPMMASRNVVRLLVAAIGALSAVLLCDAVAGQSRSDNAA